VSAADGSVQDWELATAAVYPVERTGIDENSFSVGDHVRVAGSPSTTRPSAMSLSNWLLPEGEEVLFSATSRARWTEDVSGGRWLGGTVDRAQLGLFRVWSVSDMGTYLVAARGLQPNLTPDALAKALESPPFDVCTPQGMPAIMVTPLPIQFIDRGEYIDLHLATFGVDRRIYMKPEGNPAAIPLSDLGYSTGRWMTDTLEVRTTRVGWPYIDDAGRPQTENVEIVEQFSIENDRNHLAYRQTVFDPESLIEPMIVGWDFSDIGEMSVEPVDCE